MHADGRREPRRGASAAVDPAPHREPLRNAPAVIGRLAGVRDDLVGGSVDLEHRDRPLRTARRQRAVAAGHRRDAREPLRELAAQPRRHAAAVRHAGHEHPCRVLDVVRSAGDRAAHVPERVRAGRRRIGDEEALAVGQRAEAGVARELRPGLAGAVQREHERQRAVRAARRVQVHGADALGRVDAQQVVAGAQRRARLVRLRRGVVDRERPGAPGDERHRGEADGDRGGGPHSRGRHAKTQPLHSAKVSSVTAGRMATSPSRRCRCPSPTATHTPTASSPAPSACTAT